jgi:choline dehydrogenase-like flavoprotein
VFVDARNVDPRQELESDVCVVGGGAAGIALALKLTDAGIRVSLIEGGGRSATREALGIYRVVDDRSRRLVRDSQRTSFFGGNTNHWPGNCRTLDPIDFQSRDWIPHSGWPIDLGELLPYYAEARKLCGLGEARDFAPDARAKLLPWDWLEVDPAVLDHKVMEACPEPSFARLYAARLEAAEKLRIYLHARVLRLESSANGDVVRAAEVRAADGRSLRFTARVFILAAGGIENPRL